MALKDDMAADLANVFFNEADFAEAAAYLPRIGAPVAVSVVFDSRYSEVEMTETLVQSREIQCQIRESALPTGWEKDPQARLTIRGVTYSIRAPKPDGTGVVTLVLQKV